MNKQSQEFIKLNGFKELTNVQKEVLKFSVSSKDVVAMSKTGTGKTHAYLLSISEMINPVSNKTQVLISLPTRELAYQVYQNARVLEKVHEGLRISLIVGGTDKNKSSKLVPHIIIGTPGRIKDLFIDNKIRVDSVRLFIIDEADMTLEYGFLEDIDIVFSKMVKDPQVLCFSATFPQELQIFVKKYLRNPKMIEVHDSKRDPHLKHILVNCKEKSYEDKLLDVLSNINPYVCLIFANTKEDADKTYQKMVDNGYKTLLLHGGLKPRERAQALKALNSKKFTYVVASDVASRGIDIDGITHVISLGFPSELEFYVHRAGRTGRNERNGEVYALYNESDLNAIKTLEKQGIVFNAKDIKKGRVKDIRTPSEKKKRRENKEEKEIVKSLKRNNKQKVKPNYKKKFNREVEKVKRKRRREFIAGKIKEQRVERYKEEARKKRDKMYTD